MKKIIFTITLLLFFTKAFAHDMVPTYPELRPSYLEGVLVTDLELFNKRNDVDYYEITVFDEYWNTVPFVTSYKILKLSYLERVKFSVYIRSKDKNRATYICTKSRLRGEVGPSTVISSMICSKIKKDF
jgi:hypothetical protein